MEQDRGGRRGFHMEITSIEDFAAFCALIRGEVATPQTQAQIDALAAKLNQASAPLEVALDQQQKET